MVPKADAVGMYKAIQSKDNINSPRGLKDLCLSRIYASCFPTCFHQLNLNNWHEYQFRTKYDVTPTKKIAMTSLWPPLSFQFCSYNKLPTDRAWRETNNGTMLGKLLWRHYDVITWPPFCLKICQGNICHQLTKYEDKAVSGSRIFRKSLWRHYDVIIWLP